MQISVRQSGGVTGIPFGFSLDTDDLPTDAAEQIHRLVAESDFFSQPKEISFAAGMRDGFRYRISITDNQREHAVAFDHDAISVPAEIKDIIYLAQKYTEWAPVPHSFTVVDKTKEY